MQLDKAIELLKTAAQGWPAIGGEEREEYYKALDMGRSALMRIKAQRGRQKHRNLFPSILTKLPGED